MSKEDEAKRAAAEGPAVYSATIDSMEPDIASVDPGAFYASAAISLKRIADVAELFAMTLIKNHGEKEKDMRGWAHRHGFGDLWDKAHD